MSKSRKSLSDTNFLSMAGQTVEEEIRPVRKNSRKKEIKNSSGVKVKQNWQVDPDRLHEFKLKALTKNKKLHEALDEALAMWIEIG